MMNFMGTNGTLRRFLSSLRGAQRSGYPEYSVNDALNKLSSRGAKRRGNPEICGKTKNWIASRHGLRPHG
jgi:hypothetical protein